MSQEQWGRGRHLIIDTQGVAMVKRAPFGKDEGWIRLALNQIMDESVAAFSLEQKRRGYLTGCWTLLAIFPWFN